jgi:hypothetical protein
MPIPKTHDDYHDLCKRNNLTYISDTIPKDIRKVIKAWKCPLGHVFESSFNKVRSNAVCPECKDLQNYKTNALKSNCEYILNNIPETPHDSIKGWKCSACNEVFESTYNNINRFGHKPCKIIPDPQRNNSAKKTVESYKILGRTVGLIYELCTVPKATSIVTEWKCSKHGIVKNSYANLNRIKHKGCKECNQEDNDKGRSGSGTNESRIQTVESEEKKYSTPITSEDEDIESSDTNNNQVDSTKRSYKLYMMIVKSNNNLAERCCMGITQDLDQTNGEFKRNFPIFELHSSYTFECPEYKKEIVMKKINDIYLGMIDLNSYVLHCNSSPTRTQKLRHILSSLMDIIDGETEN